MLLLLGCWSAPPATVRPDPAFIELELGAGDRGTAEAPLPFPLESVAYPVTVRTLDANRQPYPMNGRLLLKVRPGKIDGDTEITLQDGVWTGDVAVRYAFGPTRIWAADDIDQEGRTTSFAAGVSPEVFFERPTIREMQLNDDHETNNLDKEFAELRISDRKVIVVALDAAGFWATDAMDTTGNYNSVYVYTFGRPDEEIQPGARLTLLTGNDQEYLASTQLSFPTVETETGSKYSIPAPVELDTTLGCADTAMEGAEGATAHITNGTIPANFLSDADYADKFNSYTEWPVEVGSCVFYLDSAATAPDFYPPDHAGETISLTGQLKEIYGDHVLVIVDAANIVTAAQGPRKVLR